MAVGNTSGKNNKALKRVEATIAASASLSDAIDIGTGELVGIVFPSAWTAANVTISATVDGTTFNSVYDAAGSEVSVLEPGVGFASAHVVISYAGIKGLNKIKLRSGTLALPVVQAAERVITLLIKEE